MTTKKKEISTLQAIGYVLMTVGVTIGLYLGLILAGFFLGA